MYKFLIINNLIVLGLGENEPIRLQKNRFGSLPLPYLFINKLLERWFLRIFTFKFPKPRNAGDLRFRGNDEEHVLQRMPEF